MDECDSEVEEEEKGVAKMEEDEEEVAEKEEEMEEKEENHKILQTSSHLQFSRRNTNTLSGRTKIVNHKFL